MISNQLDCCLQSSYFSASSLTHTSLLSMGNLWLRLAKSLPNEIDCELFKVLIQLSPIIVIVPVNVIVYPGSLIQSSSNTNANITATIIHMVFLSI